MEDVWAGRNIRSKTAQHLKKMREGKSYAPEDSVSILD
jgi:hypothetical protein